MNLKNPDLCRVRTITAFTRLDKDPQMWQQQLTEAKSQCDGLAQKLQQQGYIVQSLRIVTNPFAEYLDMQDISRAKAGLQQIKSILADLNQNGLRIRFAIGEAKTATELALLPALIQEYGDLCNACVNIECNDAGFLDQDMILKSVETIQQIARLTPNGQGNFNFTVNFNCPSFIPYFPASYHRHERGNCVVLGLESPDLLVATLQQIQHQSANLSEQQFLALAYQQMRDALQYHVQQIEQCVLDYPFGQGWHYIGMDTSAAPSKHCASMVEVYQLLGLSHFGTAGTIERSALLTRVFKSIQCREVIGFSGLMLAVTEDRGLAAATYDGHVAIQNLLTYSSVCGIGLDTVPIAGDTPSDYIVKTMRDTGAMAFRLNKPLTVRLFPVPNKSAGEYTTFEGDDLCNCRILAIV